MLHTILLSLLPMFFVLGLGFYAGKRRRVDNVHIESLNSLLMRFALPCSLFLTTATASLGMLQQQLPLFVLLVLSMLLLFGLSYGLERLLWRQKPPLAAVQACTVALPNYAAVGIPLLATVISPTESLAVAVAIIAGSVIISPLTLLLLQDKPATAAGGERWPLLTALVNILRNPVVLAPLAGTLLALLQWPLPDYLRAAFSLMGVAVGGLALFVTGLLVSAQPFRLDWHILLSAVLKNVVHPVLVYGLALLLALPHEVTQAVVLLAAIPSGFFGILFGVNQRLPYALSGATLLCSTILGTPTLMLTIALLPAL
ncbi:AEC family transporter [Aquitalea sp.]|uniref:AEC family transporter n=1 Tax=Aquitalea sp. TaxID=1872623 RepID=UPI00258A966E|nr:AEC family transporter [Aquitalea sp.]